MKKFKLYFFLLLVPYFVICSNAYLGYAQTSTQFNGISFPKFLNDKEINFNVEVKHVTCYHGNDGFIKIHVNTTEYIEFQWFSETNDFSGQNTNSISNVKAGVYKLVMSLYPNDPITITVHEGNAMTLQTTNIKDNGNRTDVYLLAEGGGGSLYYKTVDDLKYTRYEGEFMVNKLNEDILIKDNMGCVWLANMEDASQNIVAQKKRKPVFGFLNKKKKEYTNFYLDAKLEMNKNPQNEEQQNLAFGTSINSCTEKIKLNALLPVGYKGKWESLSGNSYFDDKTDPNTIATLKPNLSDLLCWTTYNGRYSNYSFTRIFNHTPMLELEAKQDVKCAGGSDGFLKVKSKKPNETLSFHWNYAINNTNEANNLIAKTYYVTASNDLCSNTFSYAINQPDLLEIAVVKIDKPRSNIGGDGQIILGATGGAGKMNFTLTDEKGKIVATTATAYNLYPEIYSANVIDANMCSASIPVDCNKDSLVLTIPEIIGFQKIFLNERKQTYKTNYAPFPGNVCHWKHPGGKEISRTDSTITILWEEDNGILSVEVETKWGMTVPAECIITVFSILPNSKSDKYPILKSIEQNQGDKTNPENKPSQPIEILSKN